MTNFEKLKADIPDIQGMTVEQIINSEYIYTGFGCRNCRIYDNLEACCTANCRKEYKKWLESEVEEC
jgi:hypothetical protein